MSLFDNGEIWKKFESELFSWLDTPYRDNMKIKKGGVDCIRFIGETLKALKTNADYSHIEKNIFPMWWRHTDEEIMYNSLKKGLIDNGFIFVEFEYNRQQLKRGDLLLYTIRSRKMNHTAIYIPKNKMIHASVFKRKVVIEKFNNVYLKKIIRLEKINDI